MARCPFDYSQRLSICAAQISDSQYELADKDEGNSLMDSDQYGELH